MKGIVDFRSDVYALGVIAYELVTGGDLFPNLTDIDFLKAKVGKDPVDPSKIRKDCPKAFSAVILKALHREPEQRYQTVDEFKFELEHLSADGNQLKKRSLEIEDEVDSEDKDLITFILEEFPQLPYFLGVVSLVIFSIAIYFLFWK
jgi:serine/threonine protein kinase